MLLVVINPVCGNRSAASFFDDHVFPLLKAHNISVDHTLQTTSPEHAPSFISQFHDRPVIVILGSGDGTLHEIINTVPSHPIHFILVPCGTANALYSSLFLQTEGEENHVAYRLQSLLSFINRKPPSSLSLATTTFSSSSQITLSAVVVSTSLHASILHHSESLRDQYPGIERQVFYSAFSKRPENNPPIDSKSQHNRTVPNGTRVNSIYYLRCHWASSRYTTFKPSHLSITLIRH